MSIVGSCYSELRVVRSSDNWLHVGSPEEYKPQTGGLIEALWGVIRRAWSLCRCWFLCLRPVGELRLAASVGGPCGLPNVVLGIIRWLTGPKRDITWPLLGDAQGELPVDGVSWSCGGSGVGGWNCFLIGRTQRDITWHLLEDAHFFIGSLWPFWGCLGRICSRDGTLIWVRGPCWGGVVCRCWCEWVAVALQLCAGPLSDVTENMSLNLAHF